MKKLRLYLFSAVLVAGIYGVAQVGDDTMANASEPKPSDFNSVYAPAYQLPDPGSMSASAASGKELVHSTYKYLGAESVTRAVNGLPYVGNKLGCANCHMADGTQPHASPFVVVAQKYATPGIFNSRSNTFLDVPGRVNDCFERSLAGEPLPRDSQWMKDIVAYIDFLGTGIQPGDPVGHRVPRGEHQDRQVVAGAAQPAADLEPVQPGHHDVEHHRVRPPLGDRAERFHTVAGEVHLVPVERQGPTHRLADRAVVVDDEDEHGVQFGLQV
jgi:hypothetical protein